MRMLALFVAFAINFILLFYKVRRRSQVLLHHRGLRFWFRFYRPVTSPSRTLPRPTENVASRFIVLTLFYFGFDPLDFVWTRSPRRRRCWRSGRWPTPPAARRAAFCGTR